jgi:hypothetical protein
MALSELEERVPDCWACPNCNEDRIDWLLIEDDDVVDCATCGQGYEIVWPESLS